MTEPRAQRTLVKSPPELWAEISDAEALGRHLESFGAIRITRLDPETTVAWEGDRARGTVELEASGWGTKVTLTADRPTAGPPAPAVTPPRPQATASPDARQPPPQPGAVTPPQADAAPPADARQPVPQPVGPPPRRSLLDRLLRRRPAAAGASRRPRPAAPMPPAAPATQDPPAPVRTAAEPPSVAVAPPPPATPDALGDVEAVLVAVLDDLGAAHHRPFSR